MSLKSLGCVAVAACGMMVSAKDASAQSWWNPLNTFNRPAYGSSYGSPYGYNTGMNCANGVCTPKPMNSAYCPNGNCSSKPVSSAYCPNGNCGVSKCGPNGCGVNSYGYGSNVPVPAYRTTPGYYQTQRVPVTRSTNYRGPSNGYGRVNPFYP